MTRANTRQKEAYARLVQQYQPSRPVLRNILAAFFVGGAICTVAQGVLDFLSAKELPLTTAQAMTSSFMVFLGSFFTGLGVYDKLGKFAGMGAALPITGFANSIVSPAMEFKREGFVLGVSARMFQVAGPVLVYATLAATVSSVIRAVIVK